MSKNFIFFLILVSQFAFASPELSVRNEAKATKTNHYITDGFFVGGDKSIRSVALRDVRRGGSPKDGFERIVFDLASEEGASAKKLPFFQVHASPKEGRYIVSIWADVDLKLNRALVSKAFQKSANISKVHFVPQVDDGLTVVELKLKSPKKKVEVFHLSEPSRIILDIL